ncbi:MAG: hypothetical protein ACJ763_07270 [Bdellovibrionia bacterium]
MKSHWQKALVLTAISFMSTAEGAPLKTFYSASFQWNEGQSNAGKTLRIVIVKNTRPRYNEPKLVAKIVNGKRVEALCSIQNVEGYTRHQKTREAREARGNALLASSVDMSCKGTSLGALAAPATLYFSDVNAESTSRNKPILRFGTWLQGYQQAVLKTEFDQSARLMNEMKEIIRPGAEHVKLARAQ